MQIVVLFGGCSSEYSVSLKSAAAVLEGMDRSRFTPIPVGITPEGRWFLYTGDTQRIAQDAWQGGADCTPALLSPQRGEHTLLVLRGDTFERLPVDAVFPVLHGLCGEDGTVQGLCELAGIPLVGCGTLSSALCMDKDRAHHLVEAAGIPAPRSFLVEKGFDTQRLRVQAEILGYPLFVKPVRSGSSYGVTRVTAPGDLGAAVAAAFDHDGRVLVEEAIPGFEVGCAVLENGELMTGEIDEIELSGGFFDYTEKYNLLTAQIHVPARVSAQQADEIKRAAKRIFRALGCRGFARVDMFLTPAGKIVFNEVNTIPGFTAHSRFPAMLRSAGMPFELVITRAIETALRDRGGRCK